MSFFKNPNIHCIEHLLTFLPKRDIVIFGEAFPDLQEVVDSYWKNLRVLNFNNMTPRDIDAIMKNLNLCTNVKESYYTEERNLEMTLLICMVVEHFCPVLEILDISGIELEAKLASVLEYCDNLKSLSVKVMMNFYVFNRNGLFSDKTHLEHLSVIACYEEGCIAFNVNQDSGNTFLQSILLTVTTLKSLQIIFDYRVIKECYGLNKDRMSSLDQYLLSRLFEKNPELEEVKLGEHKMNGECLKSLPMGIKRLDIKECSKINSDTIIGCLRSWNLESLEMDLSNVKCVNFLEDLVAAAPTLKHVALVSGYDMNLSALEGLKHLKSLRLYKCRKVKDYSATRVGDGVWISMFEPSSRLKQAGLYTHSDILVERYPDHMFKEKSAPLRLCHKRVYSQFTPSFVAAVAICKLRKDKDCKVSKKDFRRGSELPIPLLLLFSPLLFLLFLLLFQPSLILKLFAGCVIIIGNTSVTRYC